ncbi:Diaminopropionate ammonia-lyase [Baekduia alba]|uniref:diaminopropionate ammonia-lyase n=1 Tax=Baekduia alba TaxID=2997333 RepID=UPI00234100CB|nr:diaminopropionate ammonia-lyase [Baekduia alba]WCB95141.1 Diaminopropionate ammonia-lyase [Baekduia alba]
MTAALVSLNPNWTPPAAPPVVAAGDIDRFHASIPGFAPTPLVTLPEVAAALGVERVLVKHERERLGLPSFKVVGAVWAVNVALALRADAPVPATFGALTELAAGLAPGTVLTTATDGNHGRAVAHVARRIGLPARITVPAETAAARIAAIASEGADVRVQAGSYDDAVRSVADAAATEPGHVVVSDTSWPGYEAIPTAVAAGYGTIFREAEAQLAQAGGGAFDVALVPAGVGAFASCAVARLAGRGCAVVTVEPVAADCVRRSLVAGAPVVVPGPHGSIMAGLNCGEVSPVAWPALRTGVRAAVAVGDDATRDAVRTLAAAGVPSGESGAAALAGALALAGDPAGAPLLGATVLLLDTEGVTDADAYAAILSAPR